MYIRLIIINDCATGLIDLLKKAPDCAWLQQYLVNSGSNHYYNLKWLDRTFSAHRTFINK